MRVSFEVMPTVIGRSRGRDHETLGSDFPGVLPGRAGSTAGQSRPRNQKKMKTNLLKDFRAIARGRRLTIQALVTAVRYGQPGKLVWDECHDDRCEMVDMCASWPGWPRCQCDGCGCDEPAVTTDDGGVAVCGACQDYTCDADGCVVCSRDPRTETVVESCGAGNQMRRYVRLKPPEMPESDADGDYCLYWATCGDDNHVVSRYATREEAEQAVAAQDWPPPGDNTSYLCGYEVRQMVDGVWMPLGQD